MNPATFTAQSNANFEVENPNLVTLKAKGSISSIGAIGKSGTLPNDLRKLKYD